MRELLADVGQAGSMSACGWDRTLLDGKDVAAIWCGHGVFAATLVKISALAG
jgi:hypothetical protein